MGIRIDGNNDLINAADGSLTVEGLSIDVTGIVTASGGYKVGSAYTVFSNGNVATAGVVTTTKLQVNSATNTAAEFKGAGGAGFIGIRDGDDSTLAFIGVDAGVLKFQTSGSSYSDKLTITTGGDINVASAATIKANGNATFSGIVTAASFVGDGSGLTGAGPSLTGSTNNTIVTVTGSNAIQGESTLTYDGSGTLEINDSGSSYTLKGSSAKHEIGASASDNDLVIQNNKNAVNSASNIIFKGSGSGGESVKERLRITSSGNVGIGTDNPQVKLTVSSTSPAVCDIHHIDGGTNDEARIILGALAGNPPSNRGAGIAAVNNGAGHDLIIKCSASHSAGPGEKVRITSGGLVGIASDSPTVALDVIGNVHLGSKKFIFREDSGHFGIYDSSTDTTPDNEIQVVTAQPQIRLEENSSGASKRLDLFVTSSGQPTIAANQSSQSIAFETTNSERFRITNDGVTFNGDTAAANALSDYEEGTYTAHFSVEGQSNMTMSGRVGLYCKVGQVVTVLGGGTVASTGGESSSHAIQFTNLPFPVHTTSSGQGHPFPVMMKNLSSGGISNMSGTAPYQFVGRLFTDSDAGRIEAHRSDGAQDAVNASLSITSNSEMQYMFTYLTDA